MYLFVVYLLWLIIFNATWLLSYTVTGMKPIIVEKIGLDKENSMELNVSFKKDNLRGFGSNNPI